MVDLTRRGEQVGGESPAPGERDERRDEIQRAVRRGLVAHTAAHEPAEERPPDSLIPRSEQFGQVEIKLAPREPKGSGSSAPGERPSEHLRIRVSEHFRVRPSERLKLRADDALLLRPSVRMRAGEAARATEYYDREADEGAKGSLGKRVVRPLPRRKPLIEGAVTSLSAPAPAVTRASASFWSTLGRLMAWCGGALLFAGGTRWDKLLGRDTVERRAKRLVAVFERMGGTLLKVGQQLAVRIDRLPYEYCAELSKLLDSMKPFPSEQAIAIVERSTGKPLGETFSAFDPTPIGSASISCVYQAVLKSGEKVAVKVRRPGIAETFAADIRAMRWLWTILEGLTILRPGTMKHFMTEFESVFLDELDFRREVRFQELFRRNSSKKRMTAMRYFTAPRLYPELCSSDVIVQDYSSGISLAEILAAVESQDEVALARIKKRNIDLSVVGQRYMWIANWGILSNFFFHADPHPANILVKENSELVLLDFGACGTFNKNKRRVHVEVLSAMSSGDIQGMAQAAICLFEPLPPIDVMSFEAELEKIYAEYLPRIWSRHTKWHERTSVNVWIPVLAIARRYKIPMHLDSLQVLRASMLADTIALRLDPGLDLLKEYRKFTRDAAKTARREFARKLRKGVRRIKVHDFHQLERFLDLGARAANRFQRYLDTPSFNFGLGIEKSAFSILVALYTTGALSLIVGAATLVALLSHALRAERATVSQAFAEAIGSPVVIVMVILTVLVGVRRILLRLGDARV